MIGYDIVQKSGVGFFRLNDKVICLVFTTIAITVYYHCGKCCELSCCSVAENACLSFFSLYIYPKDFSGKKAGQ